MAMKQTQTKLFDFSDVGLDFCAGSKNLFPDRFKKMLALGYNEQTVSSVAVAGNQVTFTYGGTHGYVADRVLQVTAAGGFNKEVYIDSVTENTVTCTVLDDDTAGLSGSTTTKVASLGWELLYEQANIHVYKMLHIDDTPRYVRLCFQDNASHRNAIAVCIGKTWDNATGFIDDPDALQATKDVMSPSAAGMIRWDGYVASSTHNNYTYSQGYSTYGKANIVGSKYHLMILACWGTTYPISIYGILPVTVFDYEVLQYPVLIGQTGKATSEHGESEYGNFYGAGNSYSGRAYLGNVRVRFSNVASTNATLTSTSNSATTSVLSNSIENFDTTTCMQMPIFEWATSQHLGFATGAYIAMYANDAIAPTISKTNLPLITSDIDLSSKVVLSVSGSGSTKFRATYLALPIEEVKIA